MSCRNCTPASGAKPPLRCPECGAVFKGDLVATLRPPFDPLGRYRAAVLAVVAVIALLAVWQFARGGIMAALPLVQVLIFGAFVALIRTVFQLSPVRVYEHGIELDIPRSINKSVYLPWSQVDRYEIDAHRLRYTWRPEGLIVLRDGRDPARWPYLYFPRALRITDPRIAERLRALLPATT